LQPKLLKKSDNNFTELDFFFGFGVVTELDMSMAKNDKTRGG